MYHWRDGEKVVGSSPLKKIKLWRWSKAVLKGRRYWASSGEDPSWYAPLWEIPLGYMGRTLRVVQFCIQRKRCVKKSGTSKHKYRELETEAPGELGQSEILKGDYVRIQIR